MIDDLTARIKTIEDDMKRFDRIESKVDVFEAGCRLLDKQKSQIEGQRNIVEGELAGLGSSVTAQNRVIKLDDAENELKAYREDKSRLAKLTELEALHIKQFENANALLIKYNKRLDELLQQQNTFDTERNLLLEQFEVLKPNAYKNVSKTALVKEIDDIELQVKEIEQQYMPAVQKLNALKQQSAETTGTLKSIDEQTIRLNEQLASISEALNTSLNNSEWTSLKTVYAILKQEIDVAVERERIATHNNKVTRLTEKLVELKDELKGRNYNKAKHEALLLQIESTNAKVRALNKRIIEQRAELNKAKLSFEVLKGYQEEEEKLKLRSEQLNTLKKLFKANGFVNYVSKVKLDEICHAANKRFYVLTRQQLRLEVNEKNAFVVRDFLNNGQVRSVKTLSGGQTFQASRSLALALSESIQNRLNTHQNFFFLDEGFGSLDQEALITVFETLKSLRNEGRVVGVISHVYDLQQEIDVFLKISKDDHAGSKVTYSWQQ